MPVQPETATTPEAVPLDRDDINSGIKAMGLPENVRVGYGLMDDGMNALIFLFAGGGPKEGTFGLTDEGRRFEVSIREVKAE